MFLVSLLLLLFSLFSAHFEGQFLELNLGSAQEVIRKSRRELLLDKPTCAGFVSVSGEEVIQKQLDLEMKVDQKVQHTAKQSRKILKLKQH